MDDCVTSILRQTCTDYEIVLIDDGSQDKSSDMCDNYASKYKNVYVVHQTNAGAAAARNTGIRNARGEYVIFLDSDDYWYDSQGLDKVDSLMHEDVDVVVFASKNLYCDSGEMIDDRYNYPAELNTMEPQLCLEYLITHDLLNMSAAKKAIRRDFLINNDLFFQQGIRSEDVEWGLRLANNLPRYRFLNEKLYVYRHRSNSVTTTVDEKHLSDYLGIICKFANYNYHNEEVQNSLLSYVAYQYALLLAYVTLLKPSRKKEMLDELKKYIFLFQYTSYPRSKIISTVHRIVGFHGTRYFLALYLKRSIRT